MYKKKDKYTCPRGLINSKQDKHKENQIETNYSHVVKIQKKKFESSKRETISYVHRILNKINS